MTTEEQQEEQPVAQVSGSQRQAAEELSIDRWVAASFEALNQPPEVVRNALVASGRTAYTRDQAQEAVESFMHREVS